MPENVTTNQPPPPTAVVTAGPVVSAAGGPEEAPPGVTAAPPKWGTELERMLAATGTGAGKLAVIAKARRDKFDARPDLDPDHPGRHLTAREAMDAVLADPGVSDLTKDKARQLALYGKYVPGETGPARLDAHVPPPPGTAPAKDKADKGEPGATKPAERPDPDARRIDMSETTAPAPANPPGAGPARPVGGRHPHDHRK